MTTIPPNQTFVNVNLDDYFIPNQGWFIVDQHGNHMAQVDDISVGPVGVAHGTALVTIRAFLTHEGAAAFAKRLGVDVKESST